MYKIFSYFDIILLLVRCVNCICFVEECNREYLSMSSNAEHWNEGKFLVILTLYYY